MSTTELARARVALEKVLIELDGVLSGRTEPSPESTARALDALVRGQLAIIERLGGAGGGLGLPDVDTDDEGAADGSRPIPPEALADDDDEPTLFLEQVGQGDSEDDLLDDSDDDEQDELEPGEATVRGDVGAGPRFADDGRSRAALKAFAAEDINRWLDSGTLFQMRGDLAYLNLDSSARMRFDFRGKMRDLGFGVELGLLRAPGVELVGRVLLFQRG